MMKLPALGLLELLCLQEKEKVYLTPGMSAGNGVLIPTHHVVGQ